MTADDPDPYAARRLTIAVLSAQLADDVDKACPGTHTLIQHRDRNPPWCPHCRRTRYGWNPHNPEASYGK
jgi:hypothetical protein